MYFRSDCIFLLYSGISLLYLKNHKNEQKMTTPVIPVTIRTHLNAPGTSNHVIGKFMPNIPATTPNMATTNVAVVSSSSNCISWFRTLSWKNAKTKNAHKTQVFNVQICFSGLWKFIIRREVLVVFVLWLLANWKTMYNLRLLGVYGFEMNG